MTATAVAWLFDIRSALLVGALLTLAATLTQGFGALVWSRAARVPWKQISGEMGCDRTTAWRRWQIALTKIAARLNA